MEKVAVVILNYLNYNDTLECIDSLMEEKYLEKEIIVVDKILKTNLKKKLVNILQKTSCQYIS